VLGNLSQTTFMQSVNQLNMSSKRPPVKSACKGLIDTATCLAVYVSLIFASFFGRLQNGKAYSIGFLLHQYLPVCRHASGLGKDEAMYKITITTPKSMFLQLRWSIRLRLSDAVFDAKFLGKTPTCGKIRFAPASGKIPTELIPNSTMSFPVTSTSNLSRKFETPSQSKRKSNFAFLREKPHSTVRT
jgi:hypothetical protein